MDSLVFAFGAVAPIIFTVAIGYFLKRIGILPLSVTKPLNKLVFRVLLPAMLFLNMYNMQSLGEVDPGYILYSAVMIIAVFLISLPVAMLTTRDGRRRGPILQCSFRSNFALIGIPLAISLFGDEAGALATVLSAVMIPIFNSLAVIALSIFHKEGKRVGIGSILLGIIKNPLIISIALGFVAFLIKSFIASRGVDVSYDPDDKNLYTAVLTTMEYLSRSATPLALLVLGAQFEFSAIKSMRREILAGVLMRNLVVPVLGIATALLFPAIKPVHYACLVSLFCSPVAVSSAPMSQEMGADAELAGQLVVFTTLISGLTVFVAVAILRGCGIF